MFVINSSEIGMLAGYASFKPAQESAERFWKRVRPERFQEYCNVHGNPEWNESETFVFRNSEAASLMKSLNGQNTKNSDEIKNLLKSASEDERTKNFSEREMGFLQEQAKRRVFRNHGTVKEDDTLAQWCKEQNKNAKKINKTYNLEIHPLLSVRGKIDAITDDNELVEIKNRAGGKLFNIIKDYEMAQCQTYLRMLNIKSGYLVENLRKGSESVLSTKEFELDEDFWEDCCSKVIENVLSERYSIFYD